MSRWYSRSYYDDFGPSLTVGERAQKAAKQAAALEKKGTKLSPVKLAGSTIAATFWGKAWCKNLEGYSDYENRLPRGRSYVRHGAVIDLRIAPGEVTALVQGTRLYTVTIAIDRVDAPRWKAVVAECGGKIDSVIELLQGKLSKAVMEIITDKARGLFPAPKQIRLRCSCPDSASMCKHVAAVLYGVGARLDEQPDLLFKLRGSDPTELVTTAAKGVALGGRAPAKEKQLGADLSSVFGIDLDTGEPEPAEPTPAPPRVAAKAKAPTARRRSAPKPPAPTTITGADLRLRGVPPATVQYWLKTGVLVRTMVAGVYEETATSRARLARYAPGA